MLLQGKAPHKPESNNNLNSNQLIIHTIINYRLFSSVVNVELFYDTLTLLSQIEAEKSEKKGGEWDGALEFVSKIVKLYKFLGRHDLKLSEADLTKFRFEDLAFFSHLNC